MEPKNQPIQKENHVNVHDSKRSDFHGVKFPGSTFMYLMNMVQLGGKKVAPTRVPIHGLSNANSNVTNLLLPAKNWL